MQEKESTVFVVAMVNNIKSLPPEFLRKGRFDELFFVDLPNEAEHREILKIHLEKRKKWDAKIDMSDLARSTEGFNGAELEGIVKDAVETAFRDNRSAVTTELLQECRKNTKSISDIQGDEIKELQEKLKKRDIKPTSQ